MTTPILDTSLPDRQRAIAEAGQSRQLVGDTYYWVAADGTIGNPCNSEAGAITIPFYCAKCGHSWQSATNDDCPVCERSPFDRISNSFENWWQREGQGLPGAGSPFIKAVARIAWLQGADAAIGELR